MRRRQKHLVHENHERWMVSYADFITLLFALFVVMFAASQTDKGKAKQVSAAVKQAFEESYFKASRSAILGKTTDDQGKGNTKTKGPAGTRTIIPEPESKDKMLELLPSMNRLNEELKDDVAAGRIQISLQARGLVVSLKQAAFFPSGEETIPPERYPSLEKVAAVIKKLPNPVRLEGHTDSVPIHNTRFASNWDLAAARSIAMLKLFSSEFGVPTEQMAISGYAETKPIDSNETDEGRARNRRVDILILNELGVTTEPQWPTAPAPPSGPPFQRGVSKHSFTN
jgi:chemotaxis protein MotB